MNGSGSGCGVALDRDLALLHRLEQRRLGLRRRAVDLVGQQQVGEHRALAEAERALARLDRSSGRCTSRRHQVGGELHALEVEVERGRDRLHQQRLGHAGHALEQHVAADEQRGDEARQRRRPGRPRPWRPRSRTASTASRGFAVTDRRLPSPAASCPRSEDGRADLLDIARRGHECVGCGGERSREGSRHRIALARRCARRRGRRRRQVALSPAGRGGP